MYLQTRDLSLQELSEKVGYDTPQSFSKAFKRYFGFSPIAFRNTLLLVTTETTMAEDISSIGLQEPEVLLSLPCMWHTSVLSVRMERRKVTNAVGEVFAIS